VQEVMLESCRLARVFIVVVGRI